MSWDVSLNMRGKPVQIDEHEEGGTYAIGGTTDAELNITYNYSWFYYKCLDVEEGLAWLNRKKGRDVQQRLALAVLDLTNCIGGKPHDDYWAPTPGNAGHALSILLKWANQYPDAIFHVH